MARPSKSLLELVREGTFRARRHHELLSGPDLQWKTLSRLQQEYRDAGDLFTKRRVAVRFENALPELHARQLRSRKSLDDVLATLGPPQSGDRVVNFFPRFFRHYAGPKAGRPFRLEPWQERYVREFWRRDKHGRRIYTFGFLAIPKGNGKTPLAVGLGTNALMDPPAEQIPDVYGLAGARKQASFGQEFVAKSIDRTDLGTFLRKSGSTITCPERDNGTYQLLSAEGELAHGVNPSASVVDEWWQFRHRSQREGFNALVDALQKRPGESWVQAISQAYYDFNSMMAERHRAAMAHPRLRLERDGCLAILEDEETGFLMHWYGMPEDADIENLATIRACNPLSTLDPRDIRKLLLQPGADEADWRRLHGNQPTKGERAWVPAGVWAGLRADRVRIPAGAVIYVAVDAAYSGDTTAVVYGWRAGNGRVHIRARIWSTEAQRQHNRAHVYVRGDSLDNEALVEPYIHELGRKYTVREIVFDPEYFVTEAKHLAQAGFTIAPVFPQSKEMSDAVRDTKKAIDEGKVAHDGDVELAAHIGNAIAKKRFYGTHEFDTIDKPNKTDRIDGATATCMAVWRALHGRTEGFVGGVEFAKNPGAGDEQTQGFSGGAA